MYTIAPLKKKEFPDKRIGKYWLPYEPGRKICRVCAWLDMGGAIFYRVIGWKNSLE